jgi:TolB-like protein
VQDLKNVGRPIAVFAVTGTANSPRAVLAAPSREPRTRVWGGLAGALIVLALGAWWLTRSGTAPGPIRSIAVLPLENLSGDPEQEYFTDGMTEDLITGLSRFRDLFVIARNSTLRYKGQAVDVRQVGRDLGIRYVLEGSVRRSADTIRVTAQLLDASSGEHLWAETYDRDLTARNIFELQDDITEQVVATLAGGHGVISRVGQVEARAKGTDSLTTYDCVLRSYEYEQLHTAESHLRARDCLERAVELDPDYVDAWAQLAYLYREEFQHGFNPRPGSLDRALELGLRAVELDSTSQPAYDALAQIYFSQRDFDAFFAAAVRAIELNPNNARIVGRSGASLARADRWEQGVRLVRKAVAQNPYQAWWLHLTLSHDHYRRGEYEEALGEAQKISARTIPFIQMSLVAAYGQLGREAEARTALAELLRLDPNFPEHGRDELRKFFASEALIDHFMQGLRKAGLPE